MASLDFHTISNTGCWIFSGKPGQDGYGKLKVRGKTVRAHRHYYTVYVGPIPSGLWVLHRCDTPMCVNPRHLYVGTQLDNEHDKDARGRRPPSPAITHPERMPRGAAHPRFGKEGCRPRQQRRYWRPTKGALLPPNTKSACLLLTQNRYLESAQTPGHSMLSHLNME
ncbi:MAG: HNH endonuclease [Rhizobiales bacterium]|nr:HNH endonuclease [Hyphomicrobiales bacterium]